MKERITRHATIALFVASVLLLGVNAFADHDAPPDRVARQLPYSGNLELDGAPVTALGEDALWMEVTLYDGAGADSSAVYAERMQVEVFSGRFTALIGPTGTDPVTAGERDLESVVARAQDLHLAITLLGADPLDEADDVALNGRQRLMPAPFALWSARSTDLDVAGTLEVGGDVGVGHDLTTGGDLRVGGELRAEGGVAPDFVSAWLPMGRNQALTVAHGLGTIPRKVEVVVSATTGGATQTVHPAGYMWQYIDGERGRGVIATDVSSEALILRSGSSTHCGLFDSYAAGGARRCLASGYARVMVWR